MPFHLTVPRDVDRNKDSLSSLQTVGSPANAVVGLELLETRRHIKPAPF